MFDSCVLNSDTHKSLTVVFICKYEASLSILLQKQDNSNTMSNYNTFTLFDYAKPQYFWVRFSDILYIIQLFGYRFSINESIQYP